MANTNQKWTVEHAEPFGTRNYFVYEYHYIDECMGQDPSDVFVKIYDEQPPVCCDEISSDIRKLFRKVRPRGWKAVSRLLVYKMPSFVAEDGCEGDGYGASFLVWHVKTDNNGISLLASERQLHMITGSNADIRMVCVAQKSEVVCN